MSTRTLVLIALTACGCGGSQHAGTTTLTSADLEEHAAVEKRLDHAAKVATDLADRIPPAVLKKTRCAIVIPAMSRGGLIVRAEHGKGFATCRTYGTVTGSGAWSAPAPITMNGGTLGAQVGLESVDLVMLTTTDAGFKKLVDSGFVVGPGVSVAAGPVGTGREEDTDATTFRADAVVYSRSEGLFAGAELAGATFDVDGKSTRALYGGPREAHAIFGGHVPSPPAAHGFVGAIARNLH